MASPLGRGTRTSPMASGPQPGRHRAPQQPKRLRGRAQPPVHALEAAANSTAARQRVAPQGPQPNSPKQSQAAEAVAQAQAGEAAAPRPCGHKRVTLSATRLRRDPRVPHFPCPWSSVPHAAAPTLSWLWKSTPRLNTSLLRCPLHAAHQTSNGNCLFLGTRDHGHRDQGWGQSRGRLVLPRCLHEVLANLLFRFPLTPCPRLIFFIAPLLLLKAPRPCSN